MTNDAVVPVALSTYQDDSAFEFAKVTAAEKLRPHLQLKNADDRDELVTAINKYYSIDELVEFLKQKKTTEDGKTELKFKKVTLQFPDSLIVDSATIVHELQGKLGITLDGGLNNESVKSADNCKCNCRCSDSTCDREETANQKLWILADTSYSPCCVDEVAAEHVGSELVVHFGDACLNPVDKLSAVYVFGKPYIDINSLVAKFRERYPVEEFAKSKILLMADSPHTYILKTLTEALSEDYEYIAYADLKLDKESSARIIGYQPTAQSSKLDTLNRTLVNLKDIDEEDIDLDSILAEQDLFHISTPETPRLLQLTTKFQSVTVFDPETGDINQGPFPNLMRRYRYMHMARAAGTVGLLVNTLSLANTKKLINSIGRKIKEAGKKHYIFVVGKPNVAKLANFENVEMWCILGCDHQGIIVDQNNEYYRPIVTPYELLLALSDELTWTGKWVTDFNSVLEDLDDGNDKDHEDKRDESNDQDGEDYEDAPPEFDPVTGRLLSTSRPLRQLNHLQITSQAEEDPSESNALIKKFSSTIAIKNTVSTSAVHLQNRHWTGLGSDYNNEGEGENSQEGAKLEEGRGGIARGYDYDREVHI
ncbi:putative diphthamide synthesis protein-domain-containing protein [Scheffersomyces xylosifermentans]|uniref:putative diphthamide synthesis protein-domain-containing protein n=1 Tax=Scheffersomyces xylosifermentans TaxID=1304137 RepID=UPI00315CA153